MLAHRSTEPDDAGRWLAELTRWLGNESATVRFYRTRKPTGSRPEDFSESHHRRKERRPVQPNLNQQSYSPTRMRDTGSYSGREPRTGEDADSCQNDEVARPPKTAKGRL